MLYLTIQQDINMIARLKFYLLYALRNIQRGGRWTTLAVLCIAAGVATVVALRSLGLAIGDTLIENVRNEVKGDLLIVNERLTDGLGDAGDAFPTDELARLITWADDQGATYSPFVSASNFQITKTDANQFGRPSFVGSYLIDPQTYPPTHTITAIDPPNTPIRDLFTGGNDVIISDNLARQNTLKVGDEVRVSGTTETYIVRGIVSATEETSTFNVLNGFFGFAYFDIDNARQVIDSDYSPNRIAIRFPSPPAPEALDQLAREAEDLTSDGYGLTTTDLQQRYEIISQYLGDFIVVMGLGALLIGGVGIMNTMIVLVRRRTNEIAAVKTFGVKARQVAGLFLTEALLLGIIGSVIGIIAGVGLSLLVNQYGSVALRQPIIWRIYPEALLFGLVLGILVTAIFGVVPILTAVRVRPNIILRPNENHLQPTGIMQSLALLAFVTVSLGLIVGHIVKPSFELTQDRFDRITSEQTPIDETDSIRKDAPITDSDDLMLPSPYIAGVIGVASTFIIFGILIAILWLIVFVIGKLPTFGSVTLKLALRNLSTNRLRTAITLLALSAGMLALSGITFVGEGTRELLNIQLTRSIGGNVLVIPLPAIPDSLINFAINNALRDVDVDHRTTITSYNAMLTNFDDTRLPDETYFGFSVWDSDNPDIYEQSPISVGRALTIEDSGQPIIVIPYEDAQEHGIQLGSNITLSMERTDSIKLEVVGIIAESDGIPSLTGSSALVPPNVIPASESPEFTLYTLQVPEASLNQALAELSSVIIIFSLDVSFLDSLIGNLIDQFAAIPTIVGLLSLFSAAIIMANTIALSTLERRRQLGILKAIGLKSRRILVIMLIESTIVGLLSAIIGIGVSTLVIALLSASGGFMIPLPTDARLTAVMLVIASVIIGGIATFLNVRVAIGERVMNVLRYE
jgi:ABC-type antimicrobial peptide transport system permease subunit